MPLFNPPAASGPPSYTGSADTSDATPVAVVSIPCPTDSVTQVAAHISASDAGAAQGAGYELVGTFKNAAGVVTQIGATGVVHQVEDVAGLNAALAVNGTDVDVQVTGTSLTPPEPATPTFAGTVRYVGAGGGDFATCAAAVAAAIAGDIIEVRSGYTSVEPATVTLNKSLEIRGADATAMVSTAGGAGDPVYIFDIPTGTNNVYIHDLRIQHNKTSDTSLEACIRAATVSLATPNGSTGIRIQNCVLEAKEFAVVIDASNWVLKGNTCRYLPPAGAADTHRFFGVYQVHGNCFIRNNTFEATTEATPRSICVLLTNRTYAFGPNRSTGFTGTLVVDGNTQAIGNLRQFFVQEWFRQPGLDSDPVVLGGFNIIAENNTFGANSGGAFIASEGSGAVAPLSFYGSYLLQNNAAGPTTTGKGLLAVDGAGGPGRSAGLCPIYASGNTLYAITNPSVADGSTVAGLLGVYTTIYALPAPLITPSTPPAWHWEVIATRYLPL